MSESQIPAGVYSTLEQLIELRYAARKLNLNQRRRALSLLAGSNRTTFRGRGIDFEEVRGYQPGDDIRTIDWRVTARTGEAHTKLFREERERPVLVVVDQRSPMFFGSRNCFKSVLAAELSALLSWAALQRGDRVGGLIFGDEEHREVRPRRSRRSVLGLLSHLVEMNQALGQSVEPGHVSFRDALLDLRRIARPGSALFLVSDFQGALDSDAVENLYQLARHMEITALHCSDPLEGRLPRAGHYAVSDGLARSELHTANKRLRAKFSEAHRQQLEATRETYGRLGIPLIEISTADSPLSVLQAYYSE